MLTLRLTPLSASVVRGIYGPKKNVMPERLRFLHPDVAPHYAAIGPWAVVSDMFRTPESSLAAVRAGRGAQPPGYSAHNYGLAVDLDLSASMKRLDIKRKADLDAMMEAHGWFCHRRDHLMAFEAWHYTWLGIGTAVSPKVKTIVGYTEDAITSRYGSQMAPDDAESQRMLAKLGMYRGEIDGDIGPRSREAVGAFQRAWGVRDSGKLDARTRRTLAYVSADREVVESSWTAKAA